MFHQTMLGRDNSSNLPIFFNRRKTNDLRSKHLSYWEAKIHDILIEHLGILVIYGAGISKSNSRFTSGSIGAFQLVTFKIIQRAQYSNISLEH